MALFTIGALIVGAVIVGFGLLSQNRGTPGTELREPTARVPGQLAAGRSLGEADAPVTIEIWSDFQCPACRLLAEEVEPDLVTDYVEPGTVRLVYRDAAFQGQRAGSGYDESVEAAAGARCAADQDLFWSMHNWLFANWDGENEGAFRADRLRAIAEAAELDPAAYDSCMASGTHQAAVRAETAEAVAAGITSTPTLIVNSERITGVPRYEQLAAIIDQAAR